MVQASLLSPGSSVAITLESFGAYVAAQIPKWNGPQLPCHSAEKILGGFWARFGPDAMAIAERVFEIHHGMWRGAPVTLERFREHHDGFFALPLLAEIRGE